MPPPIGCTPGCTSTERAAFDEATALPIFEVSDPDLSSVIMVWESLPVHLKSAVMAIIKVGQQAAH